MKKVILFILLLSGCTIEKTYVYYVPYEIKQPVIQYPQDDMLPHGYLWPNEPPRNFTLPLGHFWNDSLISLSQWDSARIDTSIMRHGILIK